MATIDIITRVDALCKKYEKYDVDKHKQEAMSSSDNYVRLFSQIESDLEVAMQKANDASIEKNRAIVATLNAEVRRQKTALKVELPKLEKLAYKKVKGVPKEELAQRPEQVKALAAKIDAVPDGVTINNRRAQKGPGSIREIKIDAINPEDIMLNPEQYQHSEESRGFRQEFEMRKMKQDEGLDVISSGLATLKNMAEDINEELDRQAPLVDEIETKVDKANADLRNTNKRLKETVLKMRTTRNFCIDIILMCIVLGIIGYIYNQVR
ncbi:SNARE domain containing protein [Klebsormidium nitens]|uniref:SNARE domain containing protein n=1 Tax=Klebsormidium nitens TaxID=105231 RepID=A0A1Y1ILG9_KLENI|nr:SNARE domain containing protein [Klebsormidium nitens]|eukprot:GAQ89477.1 SNARE domain containing protein [Klebsormidium nitens]